MSDKIFNNDLNECLTDVEQEEGVPNVLLYHVVNYILKKNKLNKKF